MLGFRVVSAKPSAYSPLRKLRVQPSSARLRTHAGSHQPACFTNKNDTRLGAILCLVEQAGIEPEVICFKLSTYRLPVTNL